MENKDIVVTNFGEVYAEHLKGLSSSRNPDLEIQLANNEILKVHKIILASGNEVFRKMFENEVPGSEQNRIKITDCNSSAFKVFLAYLYTSQMPPEKINLDLLVIAEKYKDLSLKIFCFEKIGAEIWLDNVAEIAKIATKYNFEELITACQTFVTKNYTHLSGTPQLESILKNTKIIDNIFKKYREETGELSKKYEELLIKSKTQRFTLGGLNLLFVNRCHHCGAPQHICQCRHSLYLHCPVRPTVPLVRFFTDDVEWSVCVSTDDYEDLNEAEIGIDIGVLNKEEVRADLRVTVISHDPSSPNITFEKANVSFGNRFVKIFDMEEYQYSRAYTVGGGFTVEFFLNVLTSRDLTIHPNPDPNAGHQSND